jgi:tyrosine-protein phosphatase SIW14
VRFEPIRSRVAAVPILLVFSLAASAAADAPVARSIGIDNFGQVNSHYYRGAQPKGGAYAKLAALGVKTVIDLTQDGEAQEASLVRAAGMSFQRIPMTTHEPPSKDKIAQFLQIVSDPANHPVYVHCQGGRHRTGVMTAVYRMTNDHWTADQAFAEMKKYRFGADLLHPEFKQFVYGYQPESRAPEVAAISISDETTTAAAATR